MIADGRRINRHVNSNPSSKLNASSSNKEQIELEEEVKLTKEFILEYEPDVSVIDRIFIRDWVF